MTRQSSHPLPTAARTLVLAAALAATMGLAAPGTAAAHATDGRLGWQVAEIARDVDRLPEIRSLHRRSAAIDRLQARLVRLERRAHHAHGRDARGTRARIDALQRQLARMERRVEHRLAARDDGRGYGRDTRHGDGRWRY